MTMARRRGGAIALLLALGCLSACPNSGKSSGGGGTRNPDGAVFQECDSVCVRPGDCARAFNDNGTCPPGFLCATRFSCSD